MTIEQCKSELPYVKIKWNGKRWYGRVSGRLNKFASVAPYQRIDNGKGPIHTILGPVLHFSWEAVARAVSDGRTLNGDDYSQRNVG